MGLPSPSALGRVAACVRSETLEHVDEVSEAASSGTTAHRFLCHTLLHGYDEALLMEHASERDWLRGIDVQRLPALHPERYAPEVSFAYHPKTGEARELGRGLTRLQARALTRELEIVGTADIAGVADEGVAIGDYKTGWGWVDPPSINWQVLTYALMAARAWGKDEAVVSIIRARADGYVYSDTFHADLFRLEQHELELRQVLGERERVLALVRENQRVKEEWGPGLHQLPAFVEGPHCKYCPARRVCPPKTAQLLALVANAAPLQSEGKNVEMSRVADGRLSDENAALAWERLKFAEAMVERLKAEVKEYARREPIPLGGGWVLGERAKTTETVVAELAMPLLEQAFGEELGRVVAGESVETTQKLTKESLKVALRKYVLPTMPEKEQKISRVAEAVLQRFREGGAISVRSGRNVEEHKVKPPEESKPLLPVGEAEEAA